MIWPFNRTKKKQIELAKRNASVEIIAHKEATKKNIKEIEQANDKINKLLDENGFTLKIWVAAGGELPKTQKGN